MSPRGLVAVATALSSLAGTDLTACSAEHSPAPETGYLMGGTITNLRTDGLVLRLGCQFSTIVEPDLLVPAGATRFTFPKRVIDTSRCFFEIAAQPQPQTCWWQQPYPNVGNADVNDLAVACTASGTFALTGTQSSNSGHSATLLPNGMVLIAGGSAVDSTLNTAELYDPVTGNFKATGSLNVARTYHQATLLANGMVLVSGGRGFGGLASAELYDPVRGIFTTTANMTVPRYNHSSTLLPNGKVLIAGGANDSAEQYLASAELYDPDAGAFVVTGNLRGPSYSQSATLLNNGLVLVVGGDGTNLAQLYDPSSGSFSLTGSMILARGAPQATLLQNGKVLLTGGEGPPYGDDQTAAEVYDPVTGTFASAGNTISCHSAATLLANGMVLFTGGGISSGFCDHPAGVGWTNGSFSEATDAELYDPSTGTFEFVMNLNLFRSYPHTGTLLPNGMVLITGGARVVPPGIPATVNTAERFSFP